MLFTTNQQYLKSKGNENYKSQTGIKKGLNHSWPTPFLFLVPGAGIEPAWA